MIKLMIETAKNFLKKENNSVAVKAEKTNIEVDDKFERYLRDTINNADVIQPFEIGKVIFHGGRFSTVLDNACFWSESVIKARSYAKPHLIYCTLEKKLKLSDVKGFIDLIIGTFGDYEGFRDFDEVNNTLNELSLNGFFNEFSSTDGIIDTTGYVHNKHEKFYIFRPKEMGKITSEELSNG